MAMKQQRRTTEGRAVETPRRVRDVEAAIGEQHIDRIGTGS